MAKKQWISLLVFFIIFTFVGLNYSKRYNKTSLELKNNESVVELNHQILDFKYNDKEFKCLKIEKYPLLLKIPSSTQIGKITAIVVDHSKGRCYRRILNDGKTILEPKETHCLDIDTVPFGKARFYPNYCFSSFGTDDDTQLFIQ